MTTSEHGPIVVTWRGRLKASLDGSRSGTPSAHVPAQKRPAVARPRRETASIVTATSRTAPVTMNLIDDCDVQQVHAVGDRADHERAEQGRPDRAAPAEQAGAADDGGGDGVQQQVAAARGLVDGEQAGGGQDAADGGHARAQREHGEAHAVDRDAGPPGRLGVAADGEDVATEAGAAGDDVEDHDEPDEEHGGERQAAVPLEHHGGHDHDRRARAMARAATTRIGRQRHPDRAGAAGG